MSLELKVTLRVYSKVHTLAKLVEVLGDATDGCSVGEIYSNNRKAREHTYWGLESNSEISNDLNVHLHEILDFLDSRFSLFLELKKDCEIDLTCMFYSDNGQGGATLSSETIMRLSKAGYSLSLDFYADVK